VSLLRYGKKMREIYLNVHLRASFTEVGTLELWCESRDTPHRWRLQFELRGEESEAQQLDTESLKSGARHSPAVTAADVNVEAGAQLIRSVFGPAGGGSDAPETLVSQMEAAIGVKRDLWPVAGLRSLGDVLTEVAAGRRKSPRHELRWLNLAGFCLRPGFGAPGDETRIHELASTELAYAEDLQCQIGMLVLLRRIAGGINASRQQELYREHTSGAESKKKGRGRNRQFQYETWRLVASLEHLSAGYRAALGQELLAKIRKEQEDAIWLWSLGRLGARIPLYGPLHSVVAAETAGEWLKVLLELPAFTAVTASAILAIARRTDDSSRDIEDAIREQAISRLRAVGIAEESIQLLSKYVPPERADAVRSFGEPLPPGLRVVSSSNCLLSVPALHSSSPRDSNPA
jgi:hypothetical protein